MVTMADVSAWILPARLRPSAGGAPSAARGLARRGIGWRLLGMILLFSSMVTLLLTAAQLYLDYRRDVGAIGARLDEIRHSSLESIGRSLWQVDAVQLRLQLEGVLRLPDVVFVEVRETTLDPHPAAWRVERSSRAPDVEQTWPVKHGEPGHEQTIGVLRVGASFDDVYHRLREKAVVILVGQAIKTFLVSLFILAMVHLLITRHLTAMAHYFSGFEIQAGAAPFRLRRLPSRSPDELEGLVTAFDSMRSHLEQAWAELRDANADLVREVAERRQAEATRKRLEGELVQAQKLQGIGLLAGGVAHDFNNLLTPILGNAQLLLAELPPDSPLREPLDEIAGAAERARQVTRQLLAYSRKQMLQIRTVDVGQLVEDMRRLLCRVLREDVRFEATVAPGAGAIRADPGQVEQVLLNLVLNAQDAMPDGGALTIDVRAATLDDADAATHPDVSPGRYVLFSVKDTGQGISHEVQQHLFEPFFTTKERGKGTGLGLSTVYGIVKQHGGHVAVDSAPGCGSTFRVYIPRAAPEEPVAPRTGTGPATARASDRPETVLVVEDDERVRKVTCQMLRHLGYEVLAADDPGRTVELARAHAGQIDLLLADVVLPKVDGRRIFEELSRLRPGLRVMYMSGYASDVVVHRGVVDEGVHFIQKPLTLDGLSRRVREVLDGR